MMSNWLTISQSAGTGNGTITVNAQSNPGFEQRTARIIVSNGTISKTVSVVQQSKTPHIDYLLITGPYNYYIPYSGGSITSASVLSEITVNAHYENYPPGQGFVDVTSAATITISPNDYTCGVNTSFDEYGKYIGTFNVYASYSGISTSNSPSVYQDAVPETRRIVYSGTSQITLTNSQKWHYDEQYHDDMNVLVNSYNSTSGTGIVVFDKDAITIPYEAFKNNTGLTAVDIPSSVSGWSESSFKDCTNLVSINGLENVAQLGNYGTSPTMNGYQFLRCSSLTHVGLPASMPCPYGAISLTYMMFSGCTNLTTLIYAGTMDQFNALSKHADWRTGSALRYVECTDGTIDLDQSQNNVLSYKANSKLTEVSWMYQGLHLNAFTPTASTSNHTYDSSTNTGYITFPSDLVAIGDKAFWGVTLNNNLSSVTIPNSVETIGESAFEDAFPLSLGDTSIIFPTGLKTIGKTAFRNVEIHNLVLPEGLTTIGNSAFANTGGGSDGGIYSITLPSTLVNVGTGIFYNQHNFQTINIPSSLSAITNGMFRYCYGLSSVTLPNSIQSIGDYAFNGCGRNADEFNITYNGTTSQWNNITLGDNWIDTGHTYPITVTCTNGTISY